MWVWVQGNDFALIIHLQLNMHLKPHTPIHLQAHTLSHLHAVGPIHAGVVVPYVGAGGLPHLPPPHLFTPACRWHG